MKKTFTLVFLFTYLLSVKAQEKRYFVYDWRVDLMQLDPVKHDVPKGTKEVKYTIKRGKKTPVLCARLYNQYGNMTKLYPINDTKNKRTTAEIVYDENQHISQVKFTKHNQPKFIYNYSRMANGKPVTQEKIKYNKIIYKHEWTYNADENPTETKSYGKKGKYTGRAVTEYHDKYNKSKTTQYNAKGKVKKVWLYDCKEEGELQTEKKNETRVCLKKEISDNILTEVYQNFNAKGRVEKHIYKYHLSDTSVFEYTRYDDKDRLTNKITYMNSFDLPLHRVFYVKGKVRSEAKCEYESGRIVSHTYLYKGKQRGKTTYTYNKEGYMTSNKWCGKKNKTSSEVLIEYIL